MSLNVIVSDEHKGDDILKNALGRCCTIRTFMTVSEVQPSVVFTNNFATIGLAALGVNGIGFLLVEICPSISHSQFVSDDV